MAVASKTRKVFDSRYEILSIVGRGSRSVVYHARDIIDGGPEVALKVLINKKEGVPTSERLRKEALAMVSSHHRYVIRLDDFHSVGDLSYLSMEFAPEGDLRKYAAKKDGKLSAAQVEKFLLQASEALEYIHKVGIVHRDIKPDNILVINEEEIRIADFGVALLPGDDANAEEFKLAVGTMDYMAPEVLEGKPCDSRTDLYALGVTAYELLTGKCPFAQVALTEQMNIRKDDAFPHLSSICPEAPKYLADIIMRALKNDPEQRYRSAKELIQSLAVKKLRSEESAAKASTPVKETKTEEATSIVVPQSKPEAPIQETQKTPENKEAIAAAIEPKPAEPIKETKTPVQPKIESTAVIEEISPMPVEKKEEADQSVKVSNETQVRPLAPARKKSEEAEAKINKAIANDSDALSKSRKPTAFIPQAVTDQLRKETVKTKEKSTQPKLNETPVLAPSRIGFALGLLVLGAIMFSFLSGKDEAAETTEATETAEQAPPPVALDGAMREGRLDFAMLPSGVYIGKISGIVPGGRSVPFTFLSLKEPRAFAVILGIEGWIPKIIPIPHNVSSVSKLRVASNGVVFDMIGQTDSTGSGLEGIVTNVISGESGAWRMTPASR